MLSPEKTKLVEDLTARCARRPTLVLFDIDGTLVHTQGAGRRALEQMFHHLYGIKDAFKDYPFSGRTDQRIMADAFDKWFQRVPTAEELENARVNYLRFLDEDLAKVKDQIVVLPGIIEILEVLRRTGVPTGLATGNLEEGARRKLAAADLWDYFAFGGYGSDAIDRAELTAVGASRGRATVDYEIPDNRVFVVGDSPLDVDAAHRAGFISIAVLTGWSSRAEMEAGNPEIVMDDLGDTAALLAALNLT